MQRIGAKLFLAAGLVASAAAAHAGMIPDGTYHAVSGGAGTATAQIINGNFINLNVTSKNFTSSTTMPPGAIDIVFPVTNNSAVNTYVTTEGITNNVPGKVITGYTVELGSGTGANFTLAPSGGSLQFDRNPPPSSSQGPGTGAGTQTLTFAPVFIPTGGTATFVFGLDVPDLAGLNPHFTLREIATFAPLSVPEPSSVVMAGLGGLGLIGFALRRRSR